LDTYFAQHGYLSIKVCARGGCSNSDGTIQLYDDNEGRGGKNIVEWASKLDGSDGRVGMYGCSYPGQIGFAVSAAVGKHSPLKASVLQCAALDTLTHGAFLAGGLLSGLTPNVRDLGLLMGSNPSTLDYFHNLVDQALAGGDTAYDRDFWKARLKLSYAKDAVANNIPVLLWSGWDDLYGEASLHTYSAYQNAAIGRPLTAPMRHNQPTTPRYQLIVGDWGHGGGLDDGIVLQWFETWVRGVNTGLQKTKTPLHLIEKGTNRYINEASTRRCRPTPSGSWTMRGPCPQRLRAATGATH
jgi:predicted acyl esterase